MQVLGLHRFFIHYAQNNNAPKRHKWLFEETGNKMLQKKNGYLLSGKEIIQLLWAIKKQIPNTYQQEHSNKNKNSVVREQFKIVAYKPAIEILKPILLKGGKNGQRRNNKYRNSTTTT